MKDKYKFRGIDVSHHQAPERMDWKLLAGQVDFVIARSCYGETPDATFVKHINSARKHKKVVGGYIFYRQTQRWEKQFARFRTELERIDCGPGDILPAIDLEMNDKYDGPVSPTIFNSEGRALVEAVADLYGSCLIYTVPGLIFTLGNPAWLLEYPLWIAHINVNQPRSPKAWDIWQYTHEGKLDGYSGRLDLNVSDHLPVLPELHRREIATVPELIALPAVDTVLEFEIPPDTVPPVVTEVEGTDQKDPVVSIVPVVPPHQHTWWWNLWAWFKFIFTSK